MLPTKKNLTLQEASDSNEDSRNPPSKRKLDFQETLVLIEDEDENSRNPPFPPPAVTPASEGFPSNLPPQSTTSTGPIHNQDQYDYSFYKITEDKLHDYSFHEITEDELRLARYLLGPPPADLDEGSSSQQPAPAAESPSILDPNDDFLENFPGDLPPPANLREGSSSQRPPPAAESQPILDPNDDFLEGFPGDLSPPANLREGSSSQRPPPTFSTNLDNYKFLGVTNNETFAAEPVTNLVKIWRHLSVKQLITLVMVGMHNADIKEMVLEMVDTIPSLRTMYVIFREHPVSSSVLRNTLNRFGDIEVVQFLNETWVFASWCRVLFKKRQSLVQALQNPLKNICGSQVKCCQFAVPNTSFGVIDDKLLEKLSLEQLQNLASTAARNHIEVMRLVYRLVETLPVLCTLHIYGLDKGLTIDSFLNAMSVYGDIEEFQVATGSQNPTELGTIRFKRRKSLLEAMKFPHKNIGGKLIHCIPKSL